MVNKIAPKQTKTALAKELGISRASLYYKPKLPEKDEKLKAEIEQVMNKHQAYGHRRVADELNINHKRTNRVMNKFNLKPKKRRKTPSKPDDLGQRSINIPNLIKGLAISKPHQVWATDFTYLWCPFLNKYIYLATIIDVFTRQIVGWHLALNHKTDLIVKALLNALSKYSRPLIHHSDMGSEYRSQQYQNLLKSLNILISMSKKASPWQNGYQESFYSNFKLELDDLNNFSNLGEILELIAKQIHYYNNYRIHSALKCSPAVFAKKYMIHSIIKMKNNLIESQIDFVRQVV
jgi:putative transposase